MDLLQEDEDNNFDDLLLMVAAVPVREGRTIWDRRNLFVEFRDLEFRRHFRMFKPTFIVLLDIVKEEINHQSNENQTNRGLPLSPADQLGVALSYMATGIKRSFHYLIWSKQKELSDFRFIPES